jgi:alpha-L-rhamnosidase
VDDTLLSPPQSDYEEWAFYTTQDITKLLQPGANALAVLLDAGWFHQVGGFGAGFSYGRPGLKALVALDYANGKTEWHTTGSGWQWKEGAIRSANIYRGERVDFRKDHDEWKSPEAGSGWKQAQVIPPVSPKTIAMDLNPIRRGQQLKPVKHWQIGPKTWLFDVGEMVHGWVRFAINEPAGVTVRLRYSEYARDGVMENVPASHWWCHGVTQSDEVIADGKPRVFEPTFTPKSFRFVEVSGLSKLPEDLVAFTVHSDARPLATFESSDPMLNRLFANGMRTWRNYVNHFIVDIPRERCVWGAESIYSEIPATYCYDLAPNHRLMNRVWLTGVMTREGIPGNIGVGKRLSTATSGYIWSVSPLFIASKLFEHYGDLEPARSYYDKLRFLVLEYPMKHSERDGTIPTPHQLADHAPISDVKRNPAKGDLITAMVYFEALNRFARIADALGKTDDATRARQHAGKVRATVMTFYDARNHTFGNGTHDSLALAYGVMTDREEQKRLAASLVGYYRANGHQFDGGFMSYEIYPQLSRFGYVDDAVKMLVNTDPPGPARSVKEDDATSFWEAYYREHDFQMNRGLNFIAFAHSIGWMITDLAGIRYAPGVPGGEQILLVPEVPRAGKPSHVKATVETPAGTVRSSWSLKDGTFAWEFNVPANVTAEIRIPADDASTVKGVEGLKPLGFQDGAVRFEAGSGSYSITSRVTQKIAAPPRPPAAKPTAGDWKEWRVSPGCSAKCEDGNLIVTPGQGPTQMLTTALPSFVGGKTSLRFHLKTAAKDGGIVRLVSVSGGKKTAQTVEFKLGPAGTWQDYTVAIPPFDGKPFSLWIGLAREKEALAFDEISLADANGKTLKRWSF